MIAGEIDGHFNHLEEKHLLEIGNYGVLKISSSGSTLRLLNLSIMHRIQLQGHNKATTKEVRQAYERCSQTNRLLF